MKTNLAASVRQRLLNRSRSENRPFDEVLQFYAMERFLYRLSRSDLAARFILKGALMLRVWESPESRPTRDIDFLGRINNDRVLIAEQVRAVLDQPVEPDGLAFDAASLATETIIEDARYEGVRVRFLARLGTARVRMQMDIGFGDIVHPAPQRAAYPAMLDFPAPEILGYSRESAIAEKFEAMVQLGELNSRMKDFYDIWLLARQFEFERGTLKTAIERTFGQRGTDVPQPLQFSTRFVDDRQPLWTTFRNRLEQPHVPERFGAVTDALGTFLGPVTDPAADRKLSHWPAGGPWRERTDS